MPEKIYILDYFVFWNPISGETYIKPNKVVKMTPFNENSRVKIPAILHLCKLGYEYISHSRYKRDLSTNIFTDIFAESIIRINPDMQQSDVNRVFEDVVLSLDSEDLGKAFYQKLTSTSGIKLVDFQTFSNNSFHVVTELPCKNGDEEFRPDITILINGMPLAFVEVKKPNNHEGTLAERKRIDTRFKNEKFRKFINISQLLVFSNNMEYDSESIVPVQGAFYSSTSYQKANFNCFREENDLTHLLLPEDDNVENFVLKDTNLIVIKHSPEFITNKDATTPTNRILTSLFTKERIAMLLKYSIAYIKGEYGPEKHIMRYPQIFATMAIENTIESGEKKGIIWHTQGSGKTALAYYNVHHLTDYFQRKNIVPKFYFIVDRIDLMTQAIGEFACRDLVVHTVDSRDELLKDFRTRGAIHNLSGRREITVVNIQKFQEERELLHPKDYDINIQRVYFLDEVHRSYNPTGSFLANLINSDRNAIIIGLTGTPLIGEERRSRDTFGDYIHKYYYNASIADGYTLKLIREGIETKYKIQLEDALKRVEILKGDADKRIIYAHEKFVEPMLEYIVKDFVEARIKFNDPSIGAMVVCDSSEQAKKLFEIFNKKYSPTAPVESPAYALVAEPHQEYITCQNGHRKNLSSALILHDVGAKDDRKMQVEDFKAGKIDILFVFNMLLTGFDAHRLKKLYIGRIIKDHNLLQMLTRVNRPFKDYRYGYIVDFADIRKEFDATNRAYFEELQKDLGDEIENFSDLLKPKEEIIEEILDIKEKLCHFNLLNAEIFDQQISQIEDRVKVLEIKKALENAKDLYNLIRQLGFFDILEKIDLTKISQLYNCSVRHLDILNLKESMKNRVDTRNLLNEALENILFMFRKVSEDELVMADQLKDIVRKARETLQNNFDHADAEFVSLYDEFLRLFKKQKHGEMTQEEMTQNMSAFKMIYDKVTELNRKNNLLKAKYENDIKYARIHKRIVEKGGLTKRESELMETLSDVKKSADDIVLLNYNLLKNESYFNQLMMQLVIGSFGDSKIALDPDSARFINGCVVKEYINEFKGIYS